MAHRRPVAPVVTDGMPARLRRYEQAEWMSEFEFAVQDPAACYEGVAGYIGARVRWFEARGESVDSARRLALNDGGSWKAGLAPRSTV